MQWGVFSLQINHEKCTIYLDFESDATGPINFRIG